MTNTQIKNMLESMSYDQLEELEAICLGENLTRLGPAVSAELERRKPQVEQAVARVLQLLNGEDLL